MGYCSWVPGIGSESLEKTGVLVDRILGSPLGDTGNLHNSLDGSCVHLVAHVSVVKCLTADMNVDLQEKMTQCGDISTFKTDRRVKSR